MICEAPATVMSNHRNKSSISACCASPPKFSWEYSFSFQLDENIHITTVVVSYRNGLSTGNTLVDNKGVFGSYEIRIGSNNIIWSLCRDKCDISSTLKPNVVLHLFVVVV
eukprot:c22810_g1_i2 orf=555-884(-)